MDNETIFIVGCARTGSTLLREMLNKSERICIAPETHFLRRIGSMGLWKQIKRFGDLSDNHNADQLVAYLYSSKKSAEKNYWGWFNKNIDRQIFRQRLLESDRSERAIFTLMLQVYAERKKGAIRSELILGEKTPTHLYYVPTLLEWFPRAKIIHTFRDPHGIFASTLKRVEAGKWGLKTQFPSLPEKVVNPLNTPIAMLHTTKTWLDAVRLHARYEQAYPHKYHLVRFEDLIVEPESQIRGLCHFLNVPFESKMLDIIVIGSSYQMQRRGPSGFDKQAINRWQEHIHPMVRAWFSILARKHLRRLGYVP